MAKSGSRQTFPLFFAYVTYQVFAWIVLVFVEQFGTRLQNLYAWSAISMVGAALSFAAIYEIFASVFRPYDALRDFAGVMFRWAGLVLLLVGIIQALSTTSKEHYQFMTAILIAERTVSVIAVGLLLFLLLFSKNLGLDWRAQTFGIAVGFGLYSAVELGLWTARIVFNCPWTPTLNLLRGLNWNVCLALWTYYMFAPERKTAAAFAPKLILERWNQVLRSVNRPAPQGAFMPNLEKIVDDVLAHQAPSGTVH
jgi:hypothetical protein